jgi:cysteine synthase A
MRNSAIGLIGDTPLVHLSRITRKRKVKGMLCAKIEYFNPGLSKKDRIAKSMIEKAEKEGEHLLLTSPINKNQLGVLKANQTVIELTSGNTGTGLAIVCAVKGTFVNFLSQIVLITVALYSTST